MTLADHNVWSFAEQAFVTAGVILAVLLPLLWQTSRDRARRAARYQASLDLLHEKADETLRVTNSVHLEEGVDGEPGTTLGTVLRDVERKVDGVHDAVAALDARNTSEHDTIRESVSLVAETVHDHGQRLDAQRRDMLRLHPEDSQAPHPPAGTIPAKRAPRTPKGKP